MSGTTFAAALAGRVETQRNPFAGSIQVPLEMTIRDLRDRIERCEATLRDLRAELTAALDKQAESRDRSA